jgi:hypothetical protein
MTIGSILSRRAFRSELDHGDTSLEFTFNAWGPVDADVKLNTLERGAVVNLDVGVVMVGFDDGNLSLSNVLEFLMNEVEDQDLLLVILKG